MKSNKGKRTGKPKEHDAKLAADSDADEKGDMPWARGSDAMKMKLEEKASKMKANLRLGMLAFPNDDDYKYIETNPSSMLQVLTKFAARNDMGFMSNPPFNDWVNGKRKGKLKAEWESFLDKFENHVDKHTKGSGDIDGE